MSVRSGTSAVYVIKIDGARSMRLVSQLGVHVPLYCTAMGKAMLAYMDPAERAELIDQVKLEPRARNTITDRGALDKELAVIARRGWSVDNEEFDFGLVCIGAPVFNRNADLAGAISLTGPMIRLPFTSWEEIGRRVRVGADAISRRLGYSVQSPSGSAFAKARS
jgi:DNA-binding IclR family transcriptional regulator